ncbi:MAG: glycosyl hydrolase family 18 protein [Candidatus Limnocylindrales bacterium]
MPTRRPLLAAVLALLVLAAPAAPVAGPPRVLAQANAPLQPGQVAQRPIDIFGYLPYWEVDSSTDAYLRYDVLNTIALFGVSFRADGSLNTTDPSYQTVTGSTASTIIQHAHTAGDRVVITFESFNADHNAQFLSNPRAQSTFIANAIALLQQLGADGVSIDMEGLSGTYFTAYGAFVAAVRTAVLTADPAGQVSVATNSNASGAKMAAAAAANGADRILLMGYGYRSASSSPVGSIDPLVTASGNQNLTWSLDQYAAAGVPAQKLILGLPLYGRQWPTVSSSLTSARQPAATFGGGGPVFLKDLATAGAGLSVRFDAYEQSVVLTGWDLADGTWTQLYYDDAASLAPKAQLALRRGLAGVGLWALGFDRGQPGYWDVLASLHRGLEVSRIAVTPFLSKSLQVTLTVGWKSAGHAVTNLRVSNDGQTWSAWRKAAATIRWTLAAGPDGLRTVYVQVRDAAGAVSTIRPVDVVLDRHGPVMATLTLAWSASAAKWVTQFNATDLSGVTEYRYQYRIGTGYWHQLTRSVTGTTVRIGAARGAPVTVRVRARDAVGLWGSWKTVTVP